MAIYEYAARCIGISGRCYLELEIDLGFDTRVCKLIKLAGIEIQHFEDTQARLHKLLIEEVNKEWGKLPLLVHTEDKDEHGRYSARVLTFVDFSNENPHNPQHWTSVNGILLEEGLAVPLEK